MKISEIKNELLSTLNPYVLNNGFKVNKTQFCLKRNDKSMKVNFLLTITYGVMKFIFSHMFKLKIKLFIPYVKPIISILTILHL